MGFDCSSLPEIALAKMVGSHEFMFTSNNTTVEELKSADQRGGILNFDGLEIVEKFLANRRYIMEGTDTNVPAAKVPEVCYLRLNPGDIDLGTESQKIMGEPTEAKFGMREDQLFKAAKLLKDAGVKKIGIHTMLITNEQNYRYCMKIAKLIFELAVRVGKEVGVEIDAVNLGGGFGVPYHPEDPEFEINQYANALAEAYQSSGLDKLNAKLYTESGRWVTAECGFLITKVINHKSTYRNYVGVDATMANLMRPGMYGAYHFIKVLSDRSNFSIKERETADIVGSLCENNDKFAVQRSIPKTSEGDLLVIHTVGAHSSCMGFQYNGRLRGAEVLIDSGMHKTVLDLAKTKLIRRAETESDYFSTLV
jgi:diaminopimelate decarboxylase